MLVNRGALYLQQRLFLHILNIRLRQRLMLQQHPGQAVQVLLLLRLQAGSQYTSIGHSLLCLAD